MEAANVSPKLCHPFALRLVIWPDANSARNSMAAVLADGSTVCLLTRRLTSLCRRLMALVVRADLHWEHAKLWGAGVIEWVPRRWNGSELMT